MSWIDAHIHLDLYEEQDGRGLLQEAFERDQVDAVVAVSMHLKSCEHNRLLAQQFEDRIMPAYGFHPEQPLPSDSELDALFDWIEEKHRQGEKFAIGEVGLPYYTRTEAQEKGEHFDETPYLALLERFAQLAAKLDRPIVLHAVYEDADKACELLERYNVKRAHFHWFKGGSATIERMIANGYYISITPDVAYEQEIQQLVSSYPVELMMTETDGPWPFEGPFEGKQTRPWMVRYVVGAIAELKGMPQEQAKQQLRQNAADFYGI
ncbi:TatD DNase family protein [Paenibacillus taihuensis]|uniref:TatD DNase family protein n=1 Tax=Paenibacillus taihuensis TaxID=1156355 RepID=A0A3D9SP40_9BACL|nr:TatD family hydrolase [Paenibacillus taihuensis]REE94334.1 TatD DNase family protein [Paenibacillus taihuensis]